MTAAGRVKHTLRGQNSRSSCRPAPPEPDIRVAPIACRGYTANAAWISFDEDKRGAVVAGKLADLAILDKPFLTVQTNQIHTVRSVLTLVDGNVVYANQAAIGSPTR